MPAEGLTPPAGYFQGECNARYVNEQMNCLDFDWMYMKQMVWLISDTNMCYSDDTAVVTSLILFLLWWIEIESMFYYLIYHISTWL